MAACTCADPMAVSIAIGSSGALISSSIDAMSANTTATMEKLAKQLFQQMQDQQDQDKQQLDEVHQTLYGKSLGGAPGALSNIRFAHAAPTEYGPQGEQAWTTFFEGASLAISLANSVAQGEIAAKQKDLADKYYDMAKSKWDRFEQNYVPLERKLLHDVAATPVRELECQMAQARADTAVATAYGAANSAFTRWAKRTKNCVAPEILTELSRQEALARTDCRSFNLEDDRWFTDYSNDKRWNRRSTVLNLGRNMASEALKYGDVSLKTFGAVGGQINTAAGGVVSALGYYGARNDTYYPTTFMSSYGNSGNSVLIDTALRQNQNATNTLNSTQ